KIAVFAPIPSASVRTATKVNPGDLRNWRKASFKSFMSFGAESVHWIDARSSPCRNHAGTQGHEAKQGDAGSEACYVERTNFKQQAGKSACQGKRRADPEKRSCCNENETLAQHAGNDPPWCRAERDANAEFASSLRRGVGDHAINADRREQQAKKRKCADQKQCVTPWRDRCGKHFLDAADFLDWFVRPDSVNPIAQLIR